MAEAFDPYRKWLGIGQQERPPNHYRLLGLELFETDPDVIQEGADRQMSHVQTHKIGSHSEHCQLLLNEITAAKLCLLNSQRRASYDAALRQKQSVQKTEAAARALLKTATPLSAASATPELTNSAPTGAAQLEPIAEADFGLVGIRRKPLAGKQNAKKKSFNLLLALVLSAAVAVAVLVAVMLRTGGKQTENLASKQAVIELQQKAKQKAVDELAASKQVTPVTKKLDPAEVTEIENPGAASVASSDEAEVPAAELVVKMESVESEPDDSAVKIPGETPTKIAATAPDEEAPATGDPQQQLAKPGYAIGGISAQGNSNGVIGLQVTYMKVTSNGDLNPDDAYTSDWVGKKSGEPLRSLAGDGQPIVGLFGKVSSDRVHTFGFLQIPADAK